MFITIVAVAFYSNSTALLSDSLDNLGDALTYGLSMYAISQGSKMKGSVTELKQLP